MGFRLKTNFLASSVQHMESNLCQSLALAPDLGLLTIKVACKWSGYAD
jgi:hypothetical protein